MAEKPVQLSEERVRELLRRQPGKVHVNTGGSQSSLDFVRGQKYPIGPDGCPTADHKASNE